MGSDGVPLSGEEAMNLLQSSNALSRLRGQGYEAIGFVIVSGPSTVELPETSLDNLDGQFSSTFILISITLMDSSPACRNKISKLKL